MLREYWRSLVASSIVLCTLSLTMFISCARPDLLVEDGKVQTAILNRSAWPLRTVKPETAVSQTKPVRDITFLLENRALPLKSVPLERNQRYYLPLEAMVGELGGNYHETSSNVDIFYDHVSYKIDKRAETITSQGGDAYGLRGGILTDDSATYLSLADLASTFGLVDSWDYGKRQISMFRSRRSVSLKKSNNSGIAALIRLEDVAAGDKLLHNDGLIRMKALADFLYEENLKFHVAWVPRFKDFANGIDNDLLTATNMENARFISMLDHMVFRGGIIGLHGYTHQHDNEKSAVSSELTETHNNDVASTSRIIESAIETANRLNIPISFFETPHYAATELQQSVIEKYFDYVYEPYVGRWSKEPLVSPRNRTTIFVSTPLDFPSGAGTDEVLSKIKQRLVGDLASVFYHPSKEFDFIEFIAEADGYPSYNYSDLSPMHLIVRSLKDQGYVTIDITQIK